MKRLISKIIEYKNISIFTFSSVFLNLSSLITGLITYMYIEPYSIGIWQSLLLIDSYSSFLRFGIVNGMNRELPFVLGQGNQNLAIKFARTTLFFILLNIFLIIILALIAFSFFEISKDWVRPLVAMILIVCVNFYNTYLLSTYRANADFSRLSNIQIIQAFLKIASIILVIRYGFNGFIAREFIITLTITFLAYYFQPFKKITPHFEYQIFLRLFKVGFPIFVSSYILVLINSIPRLFLLKYGDLTLLGIFAPLLTIISAITVIPDSITVYLYPKMTHAFGKTNDRLSLWKKALFSHIGLFIIGIPIVIVCYFFVPFLIARYIPKYNDSIPIIAIGVFTALFMSYKFGYTTLITLKEWKLIFLYIFAFAVFQFGIPFILIQYTTVLLAVVIGQLITSAIMVLVSLYTNFIATHNVSFLRMKVT